MEFELKRPITKAWQIPLDGLELFRAESVHLTYGRHSHAAYSIGVIEAGGNRYRGATHVARITQTRLCGSCEYSVLPRTRCWTSRSASSTRACTP